MKNAGWIKVHRAIMDSPFYLKEPFTQAQAWIDLLMLANHKDDQFYVRNTLVEVKRGQCAWSQEKLAFRWKWSRGRVNRFLGVLENEHQIVQVRNHVTNLISIVNYNRYQDGDTSNDTSSSTSNDTSNDTQTRSIKNEKNEKNILKKINKKNNVEKNQLILADEKHHRLIPVWNEYKEYRIAEKKGWFKNSKSEQQAFEHFIEISGGDFETGKAIVQKTIVSRWSGLFPLKTTTTNGQQPNTTKNGSPTGSKAANTLRGIAGTFDF